MVQRSKKVLTSGTTAPNYRLLHRSKRRELRQPRLMAVLHHMSSRRLIRERRTSWTMSLTQDEVKKDGHADERSN
jgi:hypothetical protein